MVVSICVVSTPDTGCVGWGTDGAVGAGVASRSATYRRTSSFRTLPSLPVPLTLNISTFSSFNIPRTAGVAREANLNGEDMASTTGSDSASVATLTAGGFATCSGIGCGGGGSLVGGGAFSSGYFDSSTSISHKALESH